MLAFLGFVIFFLVLTSWIWGPLALAIYLYRMIDKSS